MVKLYEAQTGRPLGEISDEQLKFLTDQLEEESDDDQDYYLNRATLDIFAEEGADGTLLALLRGAMGDKEELEIRWER
jgi:processive 1,2-diacylglycerol beta-glucosyltransferase